MLAVAIAFENRSRQQHASAKKRHCRSGIWTRHLACNSLDPQ
jgi:hypothetical protein